MRIQLVRTRTSGQGTQAAKECGKGLSLMNWAHGKGNDSHVVLRMALHVPDSAPHRTGRRRHRHHTLLGIRCTHPNSRMAL